MNRKQSETILREVLSLPTAPFAEHRVSEYLRSFVASRQTLKLSEDKVGNLLVRYRRGKQRIPRPICLTAHIDHPGFVASRMMSTGKLRAAWYGGVEPKYFPGSRVRFHTDGEWVRGKVTSMVTARRGTRTIVKSAVIAVSKAVADGSPGMWDFPDPVVRGSRIHARACDDLAGVAGMLACLHDLDRRRPSGDAYFLFTRAEEVGFVGAMAACKLGTIPKRCLIVAVETSSERTDARIGAGPILRVGDRATTFCSPATSFCAAVAADQAAKDKRFIYQRKLMDGGMCESSAYCELGYDATGMCVALGNYHNRNVATGKLAAEYIDLNDFALLVKWFIALVETKRRYTGRDSRIGEQLTRLRREYDPLLRQTVRAPA